MEKIFKNSLTKVGLIRLKLRIAGKDYYFLVDTGSTSNILTAEAAEELSVKIEYQSEGEIAGVGGKIEKSNVVLLEFRFNNRNYIQDFMIVEEMPSFDLLEQREGVHFDGILGTPFLYLTKAKIDFSDCKIKWGKERGPRELRGRHWYLKIV